MRNCRARELVVLSSLSRELQNLPFHKVLGLAGHTSRRALTLPLKWEDGSILSRNLDCELHSGNPGAARAIGTRSLLDRGSTLRRNGVDFLGFGTKPEGGSAGGSPCHNPPSWKPLAGYSAPKI